MISSENFPSNCHPFFKKNIEKKEEKENHLLVIYVSDYYT